MTRASVHTSARLLASSLSDVTNEYPPLGYDTTEDGRCFYCGHPVNGPCVCGGAQVPCWNHRGQEYRPAESIAAVGGADRALPRGALMRLLSAIVTQGEDDTSSE